MTGTDTDLKLLVKRWFDEVWNAKRASTIHELFAADGLAHGVNADGTPVKGPAEFEELHRAFLSAFPDFRFELNDVLQDGNRTAARFTAGGTHLGDGLGAPPTGKTVSFTGMSICLWKDGQMQEAWNNLDQYGLLTQIGALNPEG